jgi:hypothetical protein
MRFAVPDREPAASRWATRAALFSFGLIVAAAFLHRLFGMPTPMAYNIFLSGLAGAGLSILCAVIAGIVIWRTGRPGTARVLFAVCASLALLAVPMLMMVWAHDYPLINDVTTDVENPPKFAAIGRLRGPGSNSIDYDRARSADEQARAYPDIKPMVIARSSEEVYALVVDAVKRLRMQLEREEAPDPATGSPGMIEAVDRTLVMGFYDDVAIRVSGDDETSRVDIRSASRFGSGDMGHNAERIRELTKEIHARVDATVPVSEDARAQGGKRANAKPEKDGDPKSERRRRKSRDRVQ